MEGDENTTYFHRICTIHQRVLSSRLKTQEAINVPLHKHHSRLCAKFKESEVKLAIDSLNNGKALGPDDFTISFYKQNWPLIKYDVMEVFDGFCRKNIINKNVNITYIALIGKKSKHTKTSDYRLISLTTSLYIIIAKTLVTRFKSTLEETIAENQMAFVNNRQITDAKLIVNEAIDF
ncbi:LINE-1 retrotransposable element ORF2 protein [Cucumis melo var. makuwa]|uniref:LINE-1 retrotransposable element ORF2 protein n=1 Tax=Cucumis melo var. makuwa TaxID=1194695 RepID=A0A5A7SWA6_CUCMM|nr:LINE-1 retrotransposable element ORF2 protein [Cucumis melo var. makuwa]